MIFFEAADHFSNNYNLFGFNSVGLHLLILLLFHVSGHSGEVKVNADTTTTLENALGLTPSKRLINRRPLSFHLLQKSLQKAHKMFQARQHI